MTPNFDMLKSLFSYDKETGHITFNSLSEQHFNDYTDPKAALRNWKSGVRAEKEAGNRYLAVWFFGKRLKAHRVAYCLATGMWPNGFLDHINGDPRDNRFCNLRVVTNQTNLRNARLYTTNKSGACGVSWIKKRKKWYASITVDGRTITLGYFAEKQDAITARAAGEIQFGFHKNHGRAS